MNHNASMPFYNMIEQGKQLFFKNIKNAIKQKSPSFISIEMNSHEMLCSFPNYHSPVPEYKQSSETNLILWSFYRFKI